MMTVSMALLTVLSTPVRGDTNEANKSLVAKFNSAVNNRTHDDFDSIVQSDFIRHCQATAEIDIRSLNEFKAFLRQDLETFPDGRVELTQLLAENDRVGFWGVYRGTQRGAMGPFAPTNREVELDIAGMFRIQDGKIAELWITWDNLAVFSQLGINPMGMPSEDKSPVVKE
jgi:predicted ester cyclase